MLQHDFLRLRAVLRMIEETTGNETAQRKDLLALSSAEQQRLLLVYVEDSEYLYRKRLTEFGSHTLIGSYCAGRVMQSAHAVVSASRLMRVESELRLHLCKQHVEERMELLADEALQGHRVKSQTVEDELSALL